MPLYAGVFIHCCGLALRCVGRVYGCTSSAPARVYGGLQGQPSASTKPGGTQYPLFVAAPTPLSPSGANANANQELFFFLNGPSGNSYRTVSACFVLSVFGGLCAAVSREWLQAVSVVFSVVSCMKPLRAQVFRFRLGCPPGKGEVGGPCFPCAMGTVKASYALGQCR